jgi:hypothetical protein
MWQNILTHLALPEPYSFRILNRPHSMTRATPKPMPEATSPKTSEPCKAATRGLSRLFESTIAPTSANKKPVNRLLFFISPTKPVNRLLFVISPLKSSNEFIP